MKKLLLFFLFLLLTACSQQDSGRPNENASVPTKRTAAKRLMQDAIEAIRVERPSEAVPAWRDMAEGQQPTLLLMSLHPFLQPLAEEQIDDVTTLVASGSAEDFRKRGSYYRVNPAFISTQALSAALTQNLFSQIIWVFPTTDPQQVELETFRKQFVSAGFMSEAEGEALTFKHGVFSGKVRGVPFSALPASALEPFESPAILHVDLSYFKGMYTNDIKTPLYTLLRQTAKRLQEIDCRVKGVTLSYSTIEGELSLDTRFLINRLASLLADPGLLDTKMLPHWELHSEAIYTVNFYLESKVNELYERGVAEAATDPALRYGLAQRYLRDGDLGKALAQIDKAVEQDPGYAAAYLDLAGRGADGGDFKTAVILLEKARQTFPDNPFITMQLAKILIENKTPGPALALVEELQKLPWSPVVHQDIPKILEDLASYKPGDAAPPAIEQKEQQ